MIKIIKKIFQKNINFLNKNHFNISIISCINSIITVFIYHFFKFNLSKLFLINKIYSIKISSLLQFFYLFFSQKKNNLFFIIIIKLLLLLFNHTFFLISIIYLLKYTQLKKKKTIKEIIIKVWYKLPKFLPIYFSLFCCMEIISLNFKILGILLCIFSLLMSIIYLIKKENIFYAIKKSFFIIKKNIFILILPIFLELFFKHVIENIVLKFKKLSISNTIFCTHFFINLIIILSISYLFHFYNFYTQKK